MRYIGDSEDVAYAVALDNHQLFLAFRSERRSDVIAMSREEARRIGEALVAGSGFAWVWVKEYRNESAARRELARLNRVSRDDVKRRVRHERRGVWLVEEYVYAANLPRKGAWQSAAAEAQRKRGIDPLTGREFERRGLK